VPVVKRNLDAFALGVRVLTKGTFGVDNRKYKQKSASTTRPFKSVPVAIEMKNFKIFLAFLMVFALFTHTETSSANDMSRMATIESLVNEHSFIIDNSRFAGTINDILNRDKYFFQGHYYSDKPPVLALYSSIFYWILKNVFNVSFENNYHLTYYFLTLLVVGVSSCLSLVYLSKVLELFKIDGNWSNIVLFITGFSTLILPYSTVFNNHIISGSLVLFSFYNFFKIEEGIKPSILAGFFLSLAASIDITCFVFLPFALIILFNKSLKTKTIFVVSYIPMIIIYFWLNYYNSGSLIPAAMNKTLWDYPGSFFNEQNLSGLAQQNSISHLAIYSFNMLIGKRGLFSYSPILLFSVFALIKTICFKREFEYRKEYLFIATTSLAFIMLYILRSNDYSGDAYGVRWFTSLMFILCIPLAHIGDSIKKYKILRNLCNRSRGGTSCA